MKVWLALEIDHGTRVPESREIELAAGEMVGHGWRVSRVQLRVTDPYSAGYQAGRGRRDQDDLSAARRMVERYGAPPPGEGTHPLQCHRDSMG